MLVQRCNVNAWERCTIGRGGTLSLHQEIECNTNVIDGSVYYSLFTFVTDTEAVLRKRRLQIPEDKNIFNVRCHEQGAWFFEGTPYIVTGRVKILKWKPDKILIWENLVAQNGKERLVYRGLRWFRGKHK